MWKWIVDYFKIKPKPWSTEIRREITQRQRKYDALGYKWCSKKCTILIDRASGKMIKDIANDINQPWQNIEACINNYNNMGQDYLDDKIF